MAKTTKTQPDAPLCSCGCGQKTRGGTFRMGHDQRLRGFLSRNEGLKPIAAKFVASQPKSSEWRKLQVEGVKREEERVARQAEREAAKAKREAERAAAKQEKKSRKPAKAKRAGRRAAARRSTDQPQQDQPVEPVQTQPQQ